MKNSGSLKRKNSPRTGFLMIKEISRFVSCRLKIKSPRSFGHRVRHGPPGPGWPLIASGNRPGRHEEPRLPVWTPVAISAGIYLLSLVPVLPLLPPEPVEAFEPVPEPLVPPQPPPDRGGIVTPPIGRVSPPGAIRCSSFSIPRLASFMVCPVLFVWFCVIDY